MSFRSTYKSLAKVSTSEASAIFGRVLKTGMQLHCESVASLATGSGKSSFSFTSQAEQGVDIPTCWLLNATSGMLFSSTLVSSETLFDVVEDSGQFDHTLSVAALASLSTDYGLAEDLTSDQRRRLGTAAWYYLAGCNTFKEGLGIVKQGETRPLDGLVIIRESPATGAVQLRPVVSFGSISRDPRRSARDVIAMSDEVIRLDRAAKTGWFNPNNHQ